MDVVEGRPEALAPALVALSHLVLHLFADVGRGHGLTQQQAELLCTVIVRDRVRMNELGKLLHLEKSSLSGLVDRAERRGLITRTRDAKDRRAYWVELTDEGARLALRTHSDVTARLDRLIRHVSPDDQARLVGVVDRIRTAESAATE
ncbi:MarR family winged helix-turn-helix transcriptional regulator [Streptomyces capitiformicae]|uniref:MarR family winged helix-turn-helix transcriptional regulator n=1 Tax=Streptomyces capitiformicae TaxID=2014920 RepID=UPI00167A63D7|nr:MarR family transcriptional regulator [Streptomyces capitiformicae]